MLTAVRTVISSRFIKDVGVYYSVVPANFVGLLVGSLIIGIIFGIIGSILLKNIDTAAAENSNY